MPSNEMLSILEDSILDLAGHNESLLLGDEPILKLAILGLPWETSEDTLKTYFGQFGPLDTAEVLKDRYTGKSRGFGFITFLDTLSAQRALAAEHTIDGRRCEAKVALPKGEPSPPRTTRIFVARLPPTVSEAQFRAYFESFGKLADAYMPRDHSKQGYRGIGFVTYASPDSVEKVMAVEHWLNGHEVAIDRATPKEEPSILKSMLARLPLAHNQRRSFDNGAGIIGPGLMPVQLGMSGLGGASAAASSFGMSGISGMDSGTYSQLRSLSEDREMSVISGMEQMNNVPYGYDHHVGAGGTNIANDLAQQAMQAQALGLSMNGLGLHASAAATAAALQSLASRGGHLHAQGHDSMSHAMGVMDNTSMGGGGMGGGGAGMATSLQQHHGLPPLPPSTSMHTGLPGDLSHGSGLLGRGNMGGLGHSPHHETLGSVGVGVGTAAAVHQLMAAAAAQSSRRSLDSAAAAIKRLEHAGIVQATYPRCVGPRIFIGKLSKDTSEADVREYFGRFGYVMDVYLPKSKDTKMEHRGFGFVTFETKAAIQRVVSHGAHRLRGATIAIDIAMPKVDEDLPDTGHSGLDAVAGAANLQQAFMSPGSMSHQLSQLQGLNLGGRI